MLASVPLERFGAPEEVAAPLSPSCLSDAVSFITGHVL